MIQIVEVNNTERLRDFIRLPHQIYAKDRNWVAPLNFERQEFFNPKKNPFFKVGEMQLFLALRDGKEAGRISAQIHQGHLNQYKDSAGFFGFFESVEDPLVAVRLVEAAQGWLKEKGMKIMRGPFNFTMNDEVGILIDGFDTPPSILMNHNLPYYASLMEVAGLKKAKDLYAYHYPIGNISEAAVQLAEATLQYPGLKLRTLNMKKYDEEIRVMIRIFNEAWAENWGFIPMTTAEIDHMAKQLKPIIDPQMAFFAFVGNDPAAMSISLPNVNAAIQDLHGRLFPFGWAKLLWRIKKGLPSLRKCLMGIRKPYRGSKVGALSVLMNVEAHRRALKRGCYKTAELSWTLEDNERINKGIEFMGGRRYKTYRVYEKRL